MRFRVLITATVAFILAGSGCANRHDALLEFLKEHEHQTTATEYRVGIPDGLGITAPRILEIDGEQQTVGVEGNISLRLLGSVRVVGLTPKEIAAKLERLLEPYYEDPKVQVRLTRYASKKFYVFGEVGAVGPQIYTGKDSVIDALSRAGLGFVAWRSQIRVIRPHPDPDQAQRIRIDLDRMMKTGDLRLNVLLEPGDVVWVPPTPLGWMGHRIRELLQPFLPMLAAYQFPASTISATDEYTEDD